MMVVDVNIQSDEKRLGFASEKEIFYIFCDDGIVMSSSIRRNNRNERFIMSLP